MRQVIFTVPDEEYVPFMEAVKALPYAVRADAVPAVEAKKCTPEQQQWIDDFREALHEVELHQQGKIQLQTLDELINELQNNSDQ